MRWRVGRIVRLFNFIIVDDLAGLLEKKKTPKTEVTSMVEFCFSNTHAGRDFGMTVASANVSTRSNIYRFVCSFGSKVRTTSEK